MHWGHVSKTEMIWSSDPVSWMNKSRNDNKIDLHWRLCASVHLCMCAHTSSCVKASDQDNSYLFQRGKLSNPRAPSVLLGAMNQGTHGYRPPLWHQPRHTKCFFQWSFTYRNRWRTRLGPSPIVCSAFLSGRNPDKQVHPPRQWNGKGGAGWLKVLSRGGALGQAGPCGPLPAERPSACWACAFTGAHLMRWPEDAEERRIKTSLKIKLGTGMECNARTLHVCKALGSISNTTRRNKQWFDITDWKLLKLFMSLSFLSLEATCMPSRGYDKLGS